MDVTDLLLRRREMLMRKSSAAGYIQNGLVFHLDGADATSNQWIDRIGGLVYTLYNCSLSNGGVYFGGNDDCYGHSDDQVGVLYDAGTIEVVADGTGQSKYAIFAQPQTNKIAFIVYSTTKVSFAQLIRHRRYEATTQGLHTLSVSIDRMYKDSSECQVNGDDYFSSPLVSGSYLGNGGYAAYKYKGTVYQIRIYNRILTAEEVLHNQTIDINKYNITI